MDSAETETLELTDAAPHEETPPPSPDSMAVVELKNRFLIYSDQPLPNLNSPRAPAFHCQMKADSTRALYALLVDPDLPARTDVLEMLRGYNLPGMLKVLDWGMVDWTPERRRRFVIVIERPGSVCVFPNLAMQQQALGEEEVVAGLLQPLMSTLREFSARQVTHRAIRPDNLFYADAGRRMMVLGECVSTPPAHDQPSVFETIESAMAHPTGRGNGNQSHDLYSLGVTLLFLVMGRNPVADMDEEKVLANKIEFGSYAALVGQARIPLSLMEPLRGLLTDDPRERWTVTDLDMWLAGRRQSPKQPKLPQRASRPFNFQGVDYFNTRALAMALSRDYTHAVPVVRSKQLDAWLRRSLNDEARAEALQQAVSSTSANIGSGRGSEDRLVARACIPLDPVAPIRYRGFGVAIDGIGPALAAAMNNRERRQLISEIISSRLPVQWVAAHLKPRPEDLRVVQMLERLPSMIDQSAIGFGVERCLYELNPSERCQSPMFERDYVTELAQIVPALERVAKDASGRPETPLDRHVVAFIAARARRMNDEVLRGLNSAEAGAKALAGLRLLASVQEQTSSPPAPSLAQWLLGQLTPVVNSYNHRKRREKIQERVKRAASEGLLGELLAVIDDEGERSADLRGFNEAAAEYRAIEHTLRTFESERQKREEETRLFGEQLAAAAAGILVSITTMVAIFVVFI